MKKETATAVFLGVVLGIIVAFVMIFKSGQQESAKFKSLTSTTNVSPTINLNNSNLQSFELVEPKDGSIYSNDTIKIKGKANKNDLVVIESPIKELIFKNNSINFSVDFPLVHGENVIKISIYPKNQSLRFQEKELRVYYLDEQ